MKDEGGSVGWAVPTMQGQKYTNPKRRARSPGQTEFALQRTVLIFHRREGPVSVSPVRVKKKHWHVLSRFDIFTLLNLLADFY